MRIDDSNIFGTTVYTRSVREVSSHFEYLKNQWRGLDVTWQPVRGDLTYCASCKLPVIVVTFNET